MIYLLNAARLTAGDSRTEHIYTEIVPRTTQWKQNIHNSKNTQKEQ